MIPPSEEIRLQSISIWLKESSPNEFGKPNQSGALQARAQEIDEEMMAEFNEAADQLHYKAMCSKDWGFEDSLREYRTNLLVLWQTTVAERLPTLDTMEDDCPSTTAPKMPVNLGRLDACSPLPQFDPGKPVTVRFDPPSPKLSRDSGVQMTRNYYDWTTDTTVCAACGWSGTGRDASLAEMFEDGAEYCCPKCGHDFGFVPFPTIEETLTDPRADAADRKAAAIVEDRDARFDRQKLRSPDQLPDIDPSPVALVWDTEPNGHGDEEDVVIRYGERVLWRELGFYENYERFGEVAQILRTKYGRTLLDLVPSRCSLTYLYGDKGSAPAYVDRIRKDLAR